MNTKLGLFVVAFLLVSSGMTSAWADTSCVVSDSTGTPLNVRSRPNGPILGGLHNGTRVSMSDMVTVNGRQWAKVRPMQLVLHDTPLCS